jgi:ssDNA-binding Zn-finger/Zn-ribbon topoisomerase 1
MAGGTEMSKAGKHVHKLKRHRYEKTGNSVYFCTLPDCHFKIDVALALGKRAVCNLCGSEFIMNEYTIKLAIPHCDSCSKRKVTGIDGKKHYVRPNTLPIISSIAEENTEDLRSRLNSATSISSDEDI